MKKYLLIFICVISFVNAQTNSESDDFSYPIKLYNQSLYDLAAKQFIQFYNNYPASSKSPEAKYYAGMSYYKLGKYNLARIEFQSAAIEYPSGVRAGECWFKTGECYNKMDNKAEAAKAYETIRLLYPDDPLASKGLYLAGSLYSEINQDEKARQLFRVIIDRYDTSEEYFYAIVKTAQSLFKKGELQNANDLLDKVIHSKSATSSLAEAYCLKAKINKTQGDFRKAKKFYQIIVEKYSNSDTYSNASIELTEILIHEDRLGDARVIVSEAISNEKNKLIQKEMYALSGDIYFLDGKYALAFKEYESAVNDGASSISLILQLKKSLARYKQNLLSEAIDDLDNTLDSKIIPDENTYNFIIEIYINWLIKGGETQRAIDILFTRLSETKVQSYKIKYATALAELLRQKNHWREITQILQPYLIVSEQYPEMDDIIFYLGLAFENLADYDQSAYYYNRIINEFNASIHYSKATERLDYLNTYKMVDINGTMLQFANIFGKSLDTNTVRTEIIFEHANLYYDELKNYEGAEQQLLSVLEKNPKNIGDVFLLLGKTYIKLSAKEESKGAKSISYRQKANQNFKLAVSNITTCSKPDEASWLRIISGLNGDSLDVTKEKTLIEALIIKYPESIFLEDWYNTLAYSLSFEEKYFESAVSYFQKLINKFQQSIKYPSYIYSYAKLMQDKDNEISQKLFKQIASEYSHSEVAALALSEVANEYLKNSLYNEAYIIFNKLLSDFYYSEVAHENKSKFALTAIKSNNYDQVISLAKNKILPDLSSDIIIAKEFFGKNLAENLYLLAKAHAGKKNLQAALSYFQQYLSIDRNGIYADDARFDIGKIFYNQNQKNMALENFQLVSKENSELFKQSRLYMAEIYFDLGNFKEAANMYKKSRALIDDEQVLLKVDAQLIISLIRQGNIKESNTLIRQFRKTYSDQKNSRAQFIIEQGDHYRLKKEYSTARKKYDEIKKNYKSTEYVDDADYNIALIYLTLNENEKAFAILSNFYKNYSKSDKLPAALNSLGTLYYRSEKYDVAISMFKNALNSCKDVELERSILSNLIQTYTLTSFWDAAQATARKYVDKFPNAADNLDKKIVIAQASINLNQFDNAIEYLRKIKYEADSEREPEVQYYIGEAYLKAGQYENAIAEFVKIPLLSKKTKLQWEASALYYSGQSYEKLGRIDDAVRMYQEIVNRAGIDMVLKREAEKRIQQIQ